ncbi:MAG TPA: class II fructose-bisphosphatase [Candidatus Poseidoniales archaeon]|jgi:fructose-1,6-bisphosphatase class II|nr:MAG TPA: class II fructose-bisphosphatase [Candidatus Poseidoniales archaeon]HII58093.1 class II fructose-bisphosphatase [Candidatus Poseidoniaceae archaeon]|tara:strand:- start:951 stop:1907 length:957 start_codon:yes stop_codon:yes gene_type:complete
MGKVSDLSNHFLEAVDMAAIASAKWRGKGDKMAADDAAVEAMRNTFDKVPFDGRVAIGEGERDEAPMLFIGEQLGSQIGNPLVPAIDIAVDPLECTNNCADNLPNSIAVLAAAPRGTLLHAPDCYMDKIAAGPEMEGHINLDAGVAYNIEQVASVLDKPVEEVRIIALDRKRHADLFKEIKQVGAQLHLLGDGDISAALWAARPDGEHDMLLGIGAAPEGVITATAIRGIGGVFEGRLVFRSDEEAARAEQMIDDDLTRLWDAKDLCRSDDAIFVASGVCDGYLPGVKIYDNGNMHTYAELIDVQAGTLTRHDRIHKQ